MTLSPPQPPPSQNGRTSAVSFERDLETDYLVIGAGIAGLTLALKLATLGRVVLIAKGGLVDSNTWYAQGGIATVLSGTDSFDSHVNDTIKAGAGLCHDAIVRMVVERGPSAIRELIDWGVGFTKSNGPQDPSTPYHLTREGGHTHRRVIHAEDTTGREVIRALVEQVRKHQNILVLEHQEAVDLLTTDKIQPIFAQNTCLGAYVFDRPSTEIYKIRAKGTFLCTGGHGKVYLYTSNPDTASGDGLAMGWRAGCRVANLEFMQFHPTCLYHPQAKNFLISEAVRGEGAILKTREGQSFMENYHPMGSLAPRDVVARAIDIELKKRGEPCVYLDARPLGTPKIMHHFPNIHETCLRYGIDMTREMIPVVPAAHYACGGLVVDGHGRTNIQHLFAIGEVACTGLHGANRLASNSLLEALVFADSAYQFIVENPISELLPVAVPAWNPGNAIASDELVVLNHTWDEIRRLMWNYVGIQRTDKRLKRALDRIFAIRRELDSYYWDYRMTEQLVEVRNLADVAYLTIRCAMARKESRGIHFNSDYPEQSPRGAFDTILI